jgi:dipeptidyl aminopeptidase/acylaminoacyl peptidase
MGQTNALDPATLATAAVWAQEPRISPDGRTIIYRRVSTNRETMRDDHHLWAMTVAGDDHYQVTWVNAASGGACWSPDGRWLAFVSEQDNSSRLCLLPVDRPGESREVTRHRYGIDGVNWSPDGSQLAYTGRYDPSNPDDKEPGEGEAPRVRVTRRIDYKRDGKGYLDDDREQVFVIDVASGERRRLTDVAHDHVDPVWSPDGQRLAVGLLDGATLCADLVLLDAATGERTSVVEAVGVLGGWAWSSSGDRLLFAADHEMSSHPDFFVYQTDDGSCRRLTDDPGIVPHGRPAWLDEGRVLVLGDRAARSGLYLLDAESGALELMHRWEGRRSGLSIDDGRRWVAQEHESFERFGEIAVFDLENRTDRILTENSAFVLGVTPPGRWERLTVERDGFEIDAWLIAPTELDEAAHYPVILFVHGGPEGYDGYNFDAMQHLLATNGFLVVVANPRGSTSYGREFTRKVLGDWGPGPFGDLMAVLDDITVRPYADGSRLGIIGGSYGGYMTAYAISQDDRFQAAVVECVTFDLPSQYLAGDMDFAYGDLAWGGAPSLNRAIYDAQSPSSYAHKVTTPTLILHGEEDHRSPFNQGEQMFRALLKARCETEFARYPGGSHSFGLYGGPPPHREDHLRRVLEWFKCYLGEPQPA